MHARRLMVSASRAIVVPLAPRLRSVAAVTEEEWQRLCSWLARRQMVLALRCGQPLAPPRAHCSPGTVIAFGHGCC